MRLYMKLRCHHPQHVAAAKAGFSERTGRRIEGDPRLPSQKSAERPLRRRVADPLGGLWESEILPLLDTRPGMRPVMVLDEMQRRHIPSAIGIGCAVLWSVVSAPGAPNMELSAR
jgi:hypothetical protein